MLKFNNNNNNNKKKKHIFSFRFKILNVYGQGTKYSTHQWHHVLKLKVELLFLSLEIIII